MATVKISALTNLGSMTDAAVVPTSSAGTTYKLSGSTLASYLLNKISIGTPAAASGSGSIAFNSGTGVLTYTPAASVGSIVNGSYTVSLSSNGALSWPATGAVAPTFNSSSSGTKVKLWPQVDATNADYAIGIESGATWFGIPQATTGYAFNFYGGTTKLLSLRGDGQLTLTGPLKFSDGSTLSKAFSLTNLSVTTASASGSGSLSYDNTSGVLTFTPPALSGYLTGITSSQVTTALGYTPLQTVNWASPGTIGSTTPNTGAFTTLSATTTGTSGVLNLTYNPSSTSGAAIQTTGKDSQGGTGYFDFFKATNTTSGATNPNKSFRLNSTGSFEIINSGYTTTIFSLTNAGNLSIAGDIDSGGSTVNVFNSPTTLNIANGTGSGTVNLGSGVTASGNTINVNLGTNGASGSTTNVTLGSAVSGATSYVTANGVFKGTQITEAAQFVTPTLSSGVATFNCAGGQIFEVTMTNIAANFTANFTNLNLANNSCITVTLILKQGATGYFANALQIGGTAQTYNTNWFWQGGSTPSGTANKRDIIAFNIIRDGSGNYSSYAQLVTWG